MWSFQKALSSNYLKCGKVNFLELLKQFTDTVLNDLNPEIFIQFDLWKCSPRSKGKSQCNAVKYLWLSTLQEKYRVRAPSTAAIMETEEPVAVYNIRSTKPVEVIISTSPDPPYFDAGVCLMDSSFLSNFKCTYCKQWLEVRNVRTFTVDRLWGVAKVFCEPCDTEVNVETVRDHCTTRKTFHASVDVCGMMLSKAQNFLFANDFIPPHCNRVSDDIETAALTVAEESVDRVLKVESVHRSIISHTGCKVTVYCKRVHLRVALAVSVRNDGLAAT